MMVYMMHRTQNAVVIIDNVVVVIAVVVVNAVCSIVAAGRWCLLMSGCSFEQY